MLRATAMAALVLVGCGTTPSVGTDAGSHADAPEAAVDVTVDDVTPWRCERRRPTPPVTPALCNGAADRCARRLDQVVFPTTHNAMSNREERFTLPNQERSLRRQMDDGVRGLMLDLHTYEGEPNLCHGPCTIGHRRLVEGLCDIGQFMDAHPGEVMVLILESYIDGPALEAAMREAGLLDDVHTQARGAPWPTLGAMVTANRRLVVLDDNADASLAWDLPVWSFAQETPFSAQTPADLDCRTNRGDSANSLFILNHFLTAPAALPRLAQMGNHTPFLIDRARRCWRERGRLPNFVTVDFYETGDVLAASETLNNEALSDGGM